jgi:methylamine dehydrogenase accessory protein MauD
MNHMFFLTAFAVQWLAIFGMAILIVGLIRQVGMLHERLGPVGALTLTGGSKVGEEARVFILPSLNGGTVVIGGKAEEGLSTIIFFLSPTCPICKIMLPIIRSMAREYAGSTRLVLASDGDEAAQRKLIELEKLEAYPFVLSTDLGRAHGVGKLPYAVLLDEQGRVAAKGLINNREHAESLFEAQRIGIASIQDYMARQEMAG